MKIIQKVVVKQILTETSKQELLHYYQKQRAELENEIEQLRFEQKKTEHKSGGYNQNQIATYFSREINFRGEKVKLADFQINQLEILPLGSEIRERELDALQEVKVGDEWKNVQTNSEIIVKDGIVIEIR